MYTKNEMKKKKTKHEEIAFVSEQKCWTRKTKIKKNNLKKNTDLFLVKYCFNSIWLEESDTIKNLTHLMWTNWLGYLVLTFVRFIVAHMNQFCYLLMMIDVECGCLAKIVRNVFGNRKHYVFIQYVISFYSFSLDSLALTVSPSSAHVNDCRSSLSRLNYMFLIKWVEWVECAIEFIFLDIMCCV